MKERENVLRILKETKGAIQKGDPAEIKSLSNQTTNTASLTKDPDNIAVAVIVYSIGKILERENYQSLKGWDNFYKIITNSLDKVIKSVEEKNDKEFRNNIPIIQKAINKVSGKLKKYVEDVLRKAQINKASRLYEHGLSMSQTADLLGITMYELAEYVGKTGISDVPASKTMNVKNRIKVAMEMFK